MGDSNVDPNFCDFNESRFLDEQVQGIKTLSDMVGQLNHVGEGTWFQCRKKKGGIQST